MDLITLLVVLFPLSWACFNLLRSNSSRRKLPPGPYPFPIIGNALQLGQNPHRSLAKLSKTYGPLISLKIGSQTVVVASSPEMAKEVLLTHDHVLSGRTLIAAAEAQDHNINSMAFLPVGDAWRKIRKICKEQMFSTHQLDISEGLRRAKLQKLRDYVNECCVSGQAVRIEQAAFTTTLSLMSSTLFSVDFGSYDSNSSTQEYKEAIQGVMDTVSTPNLVDFFPMLRMIDPQGIKRRAEICLEKLLGIFENIINQRLESRRNNNNNTGGGLPKEKDMLEALLDLRQGNDEYDLSCNDIKHLLFDLFVAGTDTTAVTTEWVMTELLLNPEIMSNAKHELKTVVGDNAEIRESDLSKLSYLQAVIKENFRYHPTGPVLVPHKSETDVEINGYIIPKDAQILVNVWAMGRESSLWSNPTSFEPERFLDNKINMKGQDYKLLPYGSGRRVCPGQPLAHRMLHLIVATLIHNFDWKFEGIKGKDVNREEKFGMILRKGVPLRAIPIKI
ncbi:hypothetical protein BUALT_Bualt07G0170400 [Buddleja alternifolia]|uniref:Cytochrome P450 n=1 Tax=Buddleja alternifolia TaxID=168488 RepID=A0AAV6XHZ2_9LAMI|nr:hypothetical protein BUALT_Bualt07G0170400 [Buddleja alternifolia]